MYEASVSIMIKDEKQNQDPSRVIESFTAAPANISVENEIEVLQSRSLMKQVVERLHLYAPVFEEDGEKALPAYTSSPVIVKAKNPGQFKEHIKIPIAYNKEEQFFQTAGMFAGSGFDRYPGYQGIAWDNPCD